VDGPATLQPGAVVYVLKTEGNTLKVSATRPA
jgi:membrane protein implicated in regulation of membrane protease activity